MAQIPAMFGGVAMLAIAGAFFPTAYAQAEGPYDGSWVIEAAAAGGHIERTGEATCPAFRLPFEIRDNKVIGSLARSPSHSGTIVPSNGQGSSPVTGSVAADGAFAVVWESYHVAGQISGDTLHAYWTGLCGPRSAMGKRIS